MRFGVDGPPVVTDGPFLEGKEQIGGYAEIDVADLDEALRMATTWPGRGTVEIRPVVPTVAATDDILRRSSVRKREG